MYNAQRRKLSKFTEQSTKKVYTVRHIIAWWKNLIEYICLFLFNLSILWNLSQNHHSIVRELVHIIEANSDSAYVSVQFSSVAQLCPTLCDPMNCSTPGLPVHHQLPESTQIHVHRDGDAIQPSHPLSSPSPPALNLYQHQGLFQWVSSSHQVAKVLEFQLQHWSLQWIFRTDLL